MLAGPRCTTRHLADGSTHQHLNPTPLAGLIAQRRVRDRSVRHYCDCNTTCNILIYVRKFPECNATLEAKGAFGLVGR
jgi:hypothetical protein